MSHPNKPWKITLTCCGRDAGTEYADTWDEADALRESFTSGAAVNKHGYSAGEHEPGHRRSGVIERQVSEEEN